MRAEDPPVGTDALIRLVGGLVMTSGVLIALLCGGCTLNVLRLPGGLVAIPFALFFGGGPIAVGLAISYGGYRLMRRTEPAPSAASRELGLAPAVGWGVVGCGLIVAAFAVYEVFWDLLVLLYSLGGQVNDGGGVGLAFGAALEHALLFTAAAGAVEIGRRVLRARRSLGLRDF